MVFTLRRLVPVKSDRPPPSNQSLAPWECGRGEVPCQKRVSIEGIDLIGRTVPHPHPRPEGREPAGHPSMARQAVQPMGMARKITTIAAKTPRVILKPFPKSLIALGVYHAGSGTKRFSGWDP